MATKQILINWSMHCLMPRSTKRSVASARCKRMTVSHGLTCLRRTMTS
jgi:hypothetical protein